MLISKLLPPGKGPAGSRAFRPVTRLAPLPLLLLLVAFAALASPLGTSREARPALAAGALAALPSGWPTDLQLGMSDSPGGAAAMASVADFAFRYQYLAGGANTGGGWATWNADGHFVTFYIQESIANDITPVFTYYMIFQSSPGNGAGEVDGVFNNLQNTATMTAYWNDLKLFFQRAGAFSEPVVFHVEPDMWGYMQQRSIGDDASTAPAQVAATGLAELAGLPNNMRGRASTTRPASISRRRLQVKTARRSSANRRASMSTVRSRV